MSPEGVPMAVILWICAAVFIAVGCWAAARRDPMHFWSGTAVPAKSIRDIPAYSRACARMWQVYGAVYAAAGAVSLFSAACAGVLTAAACVLGLPALIFVYRRIYNTYRQDQEKSETE